MVLYFASNWIFSVNKNHKTNQMMGSTGVDDANITVLLYTGQKYVKDPHIQSRAFITRLLKNHRYLNF